jgi:hypothetical protein
MKLCTMLLYYAEKVRWTKHVARNGDWKNYIQYFGLKTSRVENFSGDPARGRILDLRKIWCER